MRIDEDTAVMAVLADLAQQRPSGRYRCQQQLDRLREVYDDVRVRAGHPETRPWPAAQPKDRIPR